MTKPRRRPSTPAPLPSARTAAAVYERPKWLGGVDRPEQNVIENRLRELEYLGVLSARQREAGELFEADYRLVHPTGGRDSLDLSPRGGEDHESDAQVERIRRASDRLRKVKRIAGPFYTGLRAAAVYRERVKLAAVVLPGILDGVADLHGLPGA